MNNKDLYDAIIVGGGPAGLTAALYLARARYRVLVLEKEKFGGQITITHEVVNYPGVISTSGEALTETMRKQAENFGAEFMLAEVKNIKAEDDVKEVITSRGTLKAFSVLIATGANPRKLGFEGENEFRGRGVAYCATCDGEFFQDKELLVVGGGFAACEEAIFLTRYASKITMLVRGEKFSCAQSIVDKVLENPKITVKFKHELLKVEGSENGIERATILNKDNNQSVNYTAQNNESFGVFVFAGYVPNTSLVKDLIKLDDSGYVITDSDMQTSISGIYAAGDICIKTLRQVVTATADGALAACAMEKHAANLQIKLGIIPTKPQEHTEASHDSEVKIDSSKMTFIDEQMLPQLNAVFSRLTSNLTFEVHTGKDAKSPELLNAMHELAALTNKLNVIEIKDDEDAPYVRLMRDNTFTGLAFHGVPGGHEFTSFILGIYNAAGPGQALDEADKAAIEAINTPLKLKVLVSLSCTMCPDLVIATQRMASLNPMIEAEVYDLNLFPKLKDQYRVMSVPCLVINDDKISFGKKNISELLKLI